MASGEWLVIGVPPALELDGATISKLPQDMAGLRVILLPPHVTSLKVMSFLPTVQNA